MKTIAIICFTDFTKEPRVLKTIKALADNFNIVIFSNGKSFAGITSNDVLSLNTDYNLPVHKNQICNRIYNAFDKIILGKIPVR